MVIEKTGDLERENRTHKQRQTDNHADDFGLQRDRQQVALYFSEEKHDVRLSGTRGTDNLVGIEIILGENEFVYPQLLQNPASHVIPVH